MHTIRKNTTTVLLFACGHWQKFCLITDTSVFSTSGHARDDSGFGQMEGFHRDEAEEEKNASNCPWVKQTWNITVGQLYLEKSHS